MCFIEIVKYQTGDGKEHPTKKKAEAHVHDTILDAFYQPLIQVIGHKNAIAAAETLYSQRADILKALDLENFTD
jgi:hypothetical protein